MVAISTRILPRSARLCRAFKPSRYPMLIILSPAKSLDTTSPPTIQKHTQPHFMAHAAELISQLRPLAPHDVAELMALSDALAVLNVNRYAAWSERNTAKNSKQAILTFDGDVYDGLQARTWGEADLLYAQDHLRILSGLYGALRPLDRLQPYRLEMGTRFANTRGKNLYAFWGDTVTQYLNAALKKATTKPQPAVLVNLASEEYYKVVQPQAIQGRIITPVFEDWKGSQYKIISFFAKRARGLMARYILQNRLTVAEDLKGFAVDGYRFDAKASVGDRWVFRRKVV